MSFVLSGPAWWRQLKQTQDQSGAGVIKCHMWMNKGAILKPFVVFVNVFHLSLKRLNDFVVSWCMWLVALQNEGNSNQWYNQSVFSRIPCFWFWCPRLLFFLFFFNAQVIFALHIAKQSPLPCFNYLQGQLG